MAIVGIVSVITLNSSMIEPIYCTSKIPGGVVPDKWFEVKLMFFSLEILPIDADIVPVKKLLVNNDKVQDSH